MPTTRPADHSRAPSGRRVLGQRLLAVLFRAALLFPLLIAAALLLAGLSGAARAEAERPACTGKNLLPELDAAGKLAPMERAAAAVPNGEGKLFRIEKAGLPPSFLFGTMHMTDPRILAVAPAAKTAFSDAGQLVIETTDMLDEAKTYGLMLARPDLTNLPKGKTLADYLTPEQRARVSAGLDARGIPFQAIQTLQPWFFSTGLMLPSCETARMAGGAKPLDLQLAMDAKAAGKPVLGLEAATEQLEAMASLSMDVQVASLIATLELGETLPDIFETMTQLYLDGRIAMITPLSEAMMPLDAVSADSIETYAAFEERIVTRRNHVMAERLAPILAKGDTFVAVGALHLGGTEGLVELLKAQGFALTRLD